MRYYDPEIGRYISRDPIGYPDGLNNYLYGSNSPINHIDPLGLWSWKSFFKAAAITVAAAAVVTAAIVAAPIVVPAIAAAAGASATTVAATATVTATTAKVVGVGLAVTGGVSAAASAYEATTGKDIGTGRTLSDDERSAAAGNVAGAALSLGIGRPVARATNWVMGKTPLPGMVTKAQDTAMLENMASRRAEQGLPGEATQSQGRDASGRMTEVNQTVRPQDGGKVPLDQHAERLTVRDLEGRPGPWTVAVEQVPCRGQEGCANWLPGNMPPGSRVITPTPTQPGGGVKAAAVGIAEGRLPPVPQVVMTVPGQAPLPFDVSALPLGGAAFGRNRSSDDREE